MDMFDINNGRIGLSSVDTLYSHVQKVYLKSRKGEEKYRNLRINVDLKGGLAISAGKVLNVQITDDNDSMFFYSLVLTQDDFRVLKAQQGLLVDFDHFPAQLVKLLKVCQSQDSPKFILILDEEESDVSSSYQNPSSNNNGVYFKVIETNHFKNLCHLSLKVIQGSDADIKNHMSLKISTLSDKLSEQEKKTRNAEASLEEALKKLEMKSNELNHVQLKLAEERSCLRLETSHQISEERDKLTRLQFEWQQRLDSEKSQLEAHHQKIVNEMNEQINLLTFNNKNLYEGKCQLETSVKEKCYKIEALDKQIMQVTQELSLLRKQNSQLDHDYHEKDKLVISLKTRMAVLEQEIKDKVKLLDKQQELLKSANEQKTFLEETLNEKESYLQKKQAAVQNLSADLMKSNEIIAKLQTDLAANKAKIKLRTDIALEQERVLEKKTEQIAAQMEAIKQLEEKVEKLSRELKSVKSELEEAKKTIEDKEIVIKKNENVINWLNRRLTEMSNPPTTTSSNSTTARTGSDFLSSAAQVKSQITNLSKGWPPWLVDSVSGGNNQGPQARKEPEHLYPTQPLGISSNVNLRPASSSTPYEFAYDQPKSRLPGDENQKPSKNMIGIEVEARSKGLDPKYLNCPDNPVTNPPILKSNNGKAPSAASSKSSSRSNINRPTSSAYFPKKSVQS